MSTSHFDMLHGLGPDIAKLDTNGVGLSYLYRKINAFARELETRNTTGAPQALITAIFLRENNGAFSYTA